MGIALIDYKMGNMFSIKNALDSLGLNSQITSNQKIILEADGAVLPGVGSFPEAMHNLRELGLVNIIKDFIYSGKPFMGICLGFQLLFNKSEEFVNTEGLGIIEGSVENLSKKITSVPVPHVGWNKVIPQKLHDQKKIGFSPQFNLEKNNYFYFVHSFFVNPTKISDVFTVTQHGRFDFCSSVATENIFACQFHPEKSGKQGLDLLYNFFCKEN